MYKCSLQIWMSRCLGQGAAGILFFVAVSMNVRRGGQEVYFMRFSVITVCLNPGAKLKVTLDSVLSQSSRDFEVIVKDGGSSDGALEEWLQGPGKREDADRRESGEEDADRRESGEEGADRRESGEREDADRRESGEEGVGWRVHGEGAEQSGPGCVRVFVEKDRGIYDAMNQAVAHAAGDFVVFMNCGDAFADDRVLERVQESIRDQEKMGVDIKKLVLYGNTVSGQNGVTIASPPKITGFTCYRNIPCHQSCFYARQLCVERPYDLQYRIRADYDHFLWCFYRAGADFAHMEFSVAVYEGGGYSESRENRRRDLEEHRQITRVYMGRGELFKYRLIMALTLAPLRRALAQSRVLSGVYHLLKEKLYRG